jgi:hypothetical protein
MVANELNIYVSAKINAEAQFNELATNGKNRHLIRVDLSRLSIRTSYLKFKTHHQVKSTFLQVDIC